MGVDGGNIQVMDGCRNYNGNLSNNYSYGASLQVATIVLLLLLLLLLHTFSILSL